MTTKLHNKMKNWLTKLNYLTTKWKTNKLRTTNIVRRKVERITTNIHIKAMYIFAITTLFNAEATYSAYNIRAV